MSITLEAVHLLLTYRCTYECDHCFLWGSPDQQGTMTIAQVRDVIDQAIAAGGVDYVYFEGGEPTLYYPVLLAGARYARDRGLDVGLVTNCHWAESVEDARLWLQPLKELGLDDFSLSSYAYFTQNDEEEELLRNAVVAARELELPMGLLEVGAPARLADLGVACGEPGEIMFKGRAGVKLAKGERLTRPPDSLTTCPYEDFTDPGRAHIGCDGNLQVCQGISCGNVFARSLAAVLYDFDAAATPVVREIVAGGPWALARAESLEPLLPLYADECHLCYELRARLRDEGRYPQVLAPDQAYGVVG
jgi:hypothetical protein